jgi:hypothetical protein
MSLDNLTGDRQPKPGSVFVTASPGRIGLVKSIEDMRLLLGWDAMAIVRYG